MKHEWYECTIPRVEGVSTRKDAIEWCHAHFGRDRIPETPTATIHPGDWTWSYPRDFKFKNEKDYMLFLLRWS